MPYSLTFSARQRTHSGFLASAGGSLFYDYEKPSELVFKDLVGKAEVMPIEEHGMRFARQLVAFAEAAEGGPRRGLATFEDGVAAAAVVEAESKLGGKARGVSAAKPKAKRSAAPAKAGKKPAARKTVKR